MIYYKRNLELIHKYNDKGKVYEDFKPEMLFEKLGLEPDWEKINYYLLLDELFYRFKMKPSVEKTHTRGHGKGTCYAP